MLINGFSLHDNMYYFSLIDFLIVTKFVHISWKEITGQNGFVRWGARVWSVFQDSNSSVVDCPSLNQNSLGLVLKSTS